MKNFLAVLILSVGSVSSATTLTLGVGETGKLSNGKVTFLSAEDSRCPMGVMCVWAGQLTIKLFAKLSGKTSMITLIVPERANTTWQGLRIVSVTPKTNLHTSPLKITITNEAPELIAPYSKPND